MYFVGNIDIIEQYKYSTSMPGTYKDIVDGAVYQSKVRDNNYITLVWHIDGASVIKSKSVQIWPITGFIVEIGESRRYAMRNIVLCGLWYGESKPNFELFQLHFVRKIKNLKENGFYVNVQGEKLFELDIQAELADLPAKAASLNMKQFNGKFGCSVCLHPGQKLQERSLVWIYPYQEVNERAPLRNHDELILHANLADQEGCPFYGVKGYSPVHEILKLPQEIPLDYMHLVLEGEFKRKLKFFFDLQNGFLSLQDISDINEKLRQVNYPHDFSNKINYLDQKIIKQAKADDFEILLLHILLPVLKDVLPIRPYCHIALLITAMQILNQEIVSEEDIFLTELLLDSYIRINVDLYGEQAQTYTAHALQHLPQQRRDHGASLVNMSNFVFEGFIATLKRQFHGTRGLIPQMVKNIGVLQSSQIVGRIIRGQPRIENVVYCLLRENKAEEKEIADSIFLLGKCFENQPNITGVNIPPDIKSFLAEQENLKYCQRIKKNGEVFHSLSYARRKNSNSYMISFQASNDAIGYGSVLFYTNSGHAAVKLLYKTNEKLFTEDLTDYVDEVIGDFIINTSLGKHFCHVHESDDVLLITIDSILDRIILVPTQPGNQSSGYISEILKSYQHD